MADLTFSHYLTRIGAHETHVVHSVRIDARWSFLYRGLLGGLQGGLNWVQAQDLHQNSQGFVWMNYNQPMTSDDALELAVDWRSPIGLRPELALAYSKNSLAHASNRIYDGDNKAPGKGHEAASSLMANLWYDLPMPDCFSRIKLYVGGDWTIPGWSSGPVRGQSLVQPHST